MKRRHVSTWILVGLWATALIWFVGSHWLIRQQETEAERMADDLVRVADAVLSEEWSEASRLLSEVRSVWEQTRKKWALHTEHSEMDDITDALVEAEATIRIADSQAFVLLHRAVDRIRTLPDRERLKMENVW